jgi:hypothetical protein
VALTTDLPTDELVFRLVPNGPEPAAAGNRLVVDAVRGDDVVGSGHEDAGAEDPGGLYVVRLGDELAAGEATEVVLDFTLTLGEGGFERVGRGRRRLLVGQRRAAAGLGARRRLGPGPVRRPARRDRDQPGRRHDGPGLRTPRR